MDDLVQRLVLPLTSVSALLLVLLTLALLGLRLQRTHRERAGRVLRDGFARRIASRDPAELVAIAASCKRRSHREDLAIVLDREPVDEGQRDALCRVMQQQGVTAMLVRDLTDRRPIVRGVAALLLAGVRDHRHVNGLANLLSDPDPDVRQVAARALAREGSEAAAWELIAALGMHSLPVPRVLEHLGQPYALRPLMEALHVSELAAIRPSITDALGMIRRPEALPGLAGMLRTGNAEERIAAGRALGRLARPEVVPMLLVALEDDVWAVRSQAAGALGRIGDPRAVPALAAALADSAWWVRANAGEALRRLGAPGLAALEGALEHPDRFARDRAREALALAHADRSAVAA
jgi:HEAT repeat protein